ncbi:CAP Gly-rich domain-containing protein [Obelidium mucronatum]|nr:CAP Gly-rich domain-containing protein [Obelidium mucronatum]
MFVLFVSVSGSFPFKTNRISIPYHLVIFKILDYDNDGIITTPDLSIFVSQISHHKYSVGDRVRVRADGRLATVRHIGETKFAPGIWAGLELDQPVGKHNGTVQGVKYFSCDNNKGVFVAYSNIEFLEHYKMAEDICDQISGFLGSSDKGLLKYEKFRDAMLGDSCYRSELDQVQIGL